MILYVARMAVSLKHSSEICEENTIFQPSTATDKRFAFNNYSTPVGSTRDLPARLVPFTFKFPIFVQTTREELFLEIMIWLMECDFSES
jgi:hypothetical protein